MGKTLEVTADRSDSIDDLVAAGELLDMRFQPGRSSLSLSAAKLLHALIRAAGADAGLPKVHRIALSKLNYDLHLSKEEVMNIVREMFGVIVELKVRTGTRLLTEKYVRNCLSVCKGGRNIVIFHLYNG